jgi:CDP-diacylglycerol---glycerol-3-phosphate 3-phosphatidyltransferase
VATQSTFGPGALATPANAVTLVRLVVTPFLLAAILADGPTWSSFLFWTAMALTDGLDGWIARRQGTTRSGAFLDPLADKFLVLGGLVALAVEDIFSWLPIGLIAFREVVVSLYRSWMGRRGVSIPARWLAKVKTMVQAVAVGVALLPPAQDLHWVAGSILWAAVALTLVTGAQYLLDGREAREAREART